MAVREEHLVHAEPVAAHANAAALAWPEEGNLTLDMRAMSRCIALRLVHVDGCGAEAHLQVLKYAGTDVQDRSKLSFQRRAPLSRVKQEPHRSGLAKVVFKRILHELWS